MEPMDLAWRLLKIDVDLRAPPEHEGRLGHYDSRYPVPEERDEGRVYLDQIASQSQAGDDEKKLMDWLNYATTHEIIHREIDPELYEWLIPRLNQLNEEQRRQAAEYPAIMGGLSNQSPETQQTILERAMQLNKSSVSVLKRQTELGEFHEDFPSSLGPVTEYHGTMNLPAVSEQGIKARSSRKRSKKYVPEQLRGQDITYTTPDRERALAFAQERAQSLGLPSSQVGVVGVRAGGLPSPIQHQEPFGVLGGTMSNVRPSAIPRANIVPVLKMPQEARDFASQVHEGQMYGEEPYMTHIEDVASQFDDPHLKRIAYLHDAVEDSETGIDAIHQQFGEDVGHAVDALTRRPDEQYFDYIQRVASHPEARQVKLADLQSNLRRGPSESLARRYEKALQMLRGDM